MIDPTKVFQQFAEQVADEFPELREILDQAKDGSISESDAMRALAEVMQGSPELNTRFQKVTMKALAPLRAEDEPQPLDHDGLILHKKRGLPRLNPLVEAALIERAQFDDDIPELRTGGLPRGIAPAVSVDTEVRDPVALGRMLTEASEQVAGKIEANEPARQKLIGDAVTLSLVAAAGTALTKQAKRDLLFDGKDDQVDVPEYRRGAVPAPLRVVQPSGATLLALTPDERKQSAWTFLSTTQGRRSALTGLVQLIEVKLTGEGFDVTVERFDPTAQDILAFHEWSVGIDGPGAMQPAFSLIDIAAVSIAKGLTRTMGDRRGRVTLEVMPINTVDIRSVGWAGRLRSGDPILPAAG